jgi:hypothetical protein
MASNDKEFNVFTAKFYVHLFPSGTHVL